MKTIAILSEKGGAGKTTLAVHLAVASQLAGIDAAIIDLDPQASAADWSDRRGKAPEAVAIPPARLNKLLDELRANEAGLVLIDTGRDSNNAGYTASQAADLVLIPCRVGGFDIRALSRTLDLCKLAQKTPFVVLNGLRPGSKKAEAEARELLADLATVAPVIVHERAAYRAASIAAQTAQETEPNTEAAAEMQRLFVWVAKQLNLSAPRSKKAAA
jgi:chromosome partitioning protein